MAGVAALVVGGLAKFGAKAVSATDSSPLVVGVANSSTGATSLNNSGTPTTVLTVIGTAASNAVLGATASGYGVIGQSDSGAGLRGAAASGYGVLGTSDSGVGVRGVSTSGYGFVGSSDAGVGMRGATLSGLGLYSTSDSGVSVRATSNAGTGVYSSVVSGTAVFGSVSQSGGQAARFDGPVTVNGDFTATGIKSAVVPHPDGSSRRLYCMESPESYFEDFGEARLTNGRAHVVLDADFAAIVHAGYQVFLTEYGDAGGLFIGRRGASGFDVHARNGSGGSFGYRVVARRKDIVGPRLQRVDLNTEPRLPAAAIAVEGDAARFSGGADTRQFQRP